MGVVDAYMNTEVAAGKLASPAKQGGAVNLTSIQTFEVLAADDDGSKFRIAKNLNPNLIPHRITVMCDALTSGNDWDVGLYETELGAEIDKNVLADALDLSSASKVLDGLKDVAIENRHKRLYELAGHTLENRKAGYDLVLTANTIGSAAGTVTVICEFIQG